MKLYTVIILSVILCFIIICFNCDITEHYGYYRYKYPKYCKSCGEKSRGGCNNCVNCGYCLTPNGHGECVTGDENGPYFREDCVDYEYNNPIFSYISSWFYPLWRNNRYYYDIRGYPKSTYKRYIRDHPRARRTHRRWRRHRNENRRDDRKQNRRRRKKDIYKN